MPRPSRHVPAAEYNAFECIQTNVHGAENVVQRRASMSASRKIVALSTDKAANPGPYGASKLPVRQIFDGGHHPERT